jgi:hypothetical protein
MRFFLALIICLLGCGSGNAQQFVALYPQFQVGLGTGDFNYYPINWLVTADGPNLFGNSPGILSAAQTPTTAPTDIATFTATASGTSLVVSAVSSGNLVVSAAPRSAIFIAGTNQNVGINAGPANGGPGTYTLSGTLNVASPTTFTERTTINYGSDVGANCPNSGTQCTLSWTGTGAITFIGGALITITGGNTGGCSSSGSGTGTVFFSGPNCSFTLYGPNGVAFQPFDFPFQGYLGNTISYSNMAYVAMVRNSDLTRWAACKSGSDNYVSCGTPEWITLYKSLAPKAVRPLGWLNNYILLGQTPWSGRTPISSSIWLGYYVPPGEWAGVATGTDQYTVGSYPNMPTNWTDGEQFVVSMSGASPNYPELVISGSPSSDSGTVQIGFAPSSTLTSAAITSCTLSVCTLTGTPSATVQLGMYINDGVDAAGACVVTTVISSGNYTVTGCSAVGSTTMYAFTPLVNLQDVMFLNAIAVYGAGGQGQIWPTTGMSFSCNGGKFGCTDLSGSTYSSSWTSAGFAVTTTTVNVASRGAKFVVGNGLGSAVILAAGLNTDNATFTYDAKLNAVIYSVGLPNGQVPWEVQAGAANALGASLWTISPIWYREDFDQAYTNWSNLMCPLATYGWWPEDSDEQWATLTNANLFSAEAYALGITSPPNASGGGLAYRQMFGPVKKACAGAYTVLGVSTVGVPNSISTTQTYKLNGAALTGNNNRLYCEFFGGSYSAGTCTGDTWDGVSAEFATNGNRPIDFADAVAVANYYAPSQMASPVNSGLSLTPSYYNILGSCGTVSCNGAIAAAVCDTSASPHQWIGTASSVSGQVITLQSNAVSGVTAGLFVADSTSPSALATWTRATLVSGANVTIDNAPLGTISNGDTITFTGCGSGSTQEAFAFVYNDSINGALIGQVPCVTNGNPIACVQQDFISGPSPNFWNGIAASYTPPKGLVGYEGGFSAFSPQSTALGGTCPGGGGVGGTCLATIPNVILASLASGGTTTATATLPSTTIVSGSYSNTTGVLSLTDAASLGFGTSVWGTVTISGATGTNASQVNGVWLLYEVNAVTKTASLYLGPGLGTIALTGGTIGATLPLTVNTVFNVKVAGATPSGYNGIVSATVTGANTFTYTVAGGLSSPATGTITIVAQDNLVATDASNLQQLYFDFRNNNYYALLTSVEHQYWTSNSQVAAAGNEDPILNVQGAPTTAAGIPAGTQNWSILHTVPSPNQWTNYNAICAIDGGSCVP